MRRTFHAVLVAFGLFVVVGCSKQLPTEPATPQLQAVVVFVPAVPIPKPHVGECEDRSGYYVRSGATTRYSDSACTVEIPQ